MREKIGKISEKDANELQNVFERKTALESLLSISTDNPLLINEKVYEKFIKDYRLTCESLQHKWGEIGKKYALKRAENGTWTIDFNHNEIYLVFE